MMTKRLLLLAAAIWTVWQLGGCGPGPAQGPQMQIVSTDKTKGQTSPQDAPTARDARARADTTVTANKPEPPPPPKPQLDPARITKENFDRLELGMSEAEVCDILGPPSSERTLEGDGKELTWQTGAKHISATFREGRLRVVDSRNLGSK
jgi:hypothetical protein